MKISPVNLNNNYKKSSFINAGMSATKPIVYDSVSFKNKFKKEHTKEEILYSKAQSHYKDAQKIKSNSKKILKRSEKLINNGAKIAQQSRKILENAKATIEEYQAIKETEVYTQNALGQKTAQYRILADGSHFVIKLAPNGNSIAQILMSADKRKCSVIELDPNNPQYRDVWEFENNKLVKFDKNQANLRNFYARKTFYYDSEKTPNRIDVYDKGEKLPFEKYYLNESGNLARYSRHRYFDSIDGEIRKDYFFGLKGLKVYHDTVGDNDPNVEIDYGMNGKCQKVAILDSENILTEYSYDLDSAPSYITCYTEPKEHYLCLAGKATRWE